MTGDYVQPSLGRITVAELAADWLARKKQATAPSHYRTLESAWRVHVQPRWGTVSVADIHLLGVEAWIAGMVRNGAGATTVIRAHGVLSGILADAVKAKRLAANPATGVENLPRKSAKKRVYLSSDDVARLADECGGHRALVLVLAYTGIRRGEAIALRVVDVEFLRRRLSVSENAVQRRTARRGADEGPQGALGAGARVRAERTGTAVQGQGAGRSCLCWPRRRLSAAAEVVNRVVPRRRETGEGSEGHSPRLETLLRQPGGVRWGQCACFAAHARAHVGEDDAGHLCGLV